MNEQEVKKILETYAKDCGAEGYLDGSHLDEAIASLKSLEPDVEEIEKVISEYIYIINVDRDLSLDYNSVDEFKKECATAIVNYLKGEKNG